MTCTNAIDWAQHVLKTSGHSLHQSTLEWIQDTAWSTVYRLQTEKDAFFLKIVPPALSLETKIIVFLQQEFNACVPKLIADNQSKDIQMTKK